MTPGEAVSRKQRGILDDTGHADVSVEESQSSDDARANLRAAILRSAFDRTPVELPDFTSRTDSNGDEWPVDFFADGVADWSTIADARPTRYPADPDCRPPRPSLWTRIAGWFR